MEKGWGLPGALYPAQKGHRRAGSSNSPRDGGDARAIFVHKVPSCIENPAVVQGHQGMSGCGGVVLAVLAVCILQGRKLVLTQHLVHHKFPGGKQGAGGSGLGNIAAPCCFGFSPARAAELGLQPPRSPHPWAVLTATKEGGEDLSCRVSRCSSGPEAGLSRARGTQCLSLLLLTSLLISGHNHPLLLNSAGAGTLS